MFSWKTGTEQYKPLCLYDVNLTCVKSTSGNVLTAQQGIGVLLSLRHEAEFGENSHRFVAGYTGLSKKMDGIWNRYNLKSTGRIYTFCVLKCSEKFKVLDLP